MTVTIKATLYHATWCGHCKTLLPEWKKVKEALSKGDKKNVSSGNEIILNDFEESQIKDKNILINGQEIRGYPTLKIEVSTDGKKPIEYEYDGKRKFADIKHHLTEIAPKNI